jgi:hypothetical protein
MPGLPTGQKSTEQRSVRGNESKGDTVVVTKKTTKKPRKDRSDITVASLEKKHGMPPGTVRNSDGRDTRGDKKLGTIRKQATKKGSEADQFVDAANDHMERAWEKIYERRAKNKRVA